MLIRCARCQAIFSVQDGLAGPVQRAFRVECGRCQAVFDAQSGQLPEAHRTPAPRRIPTPVPFQRPVAVAAPPAAPQAVERHATPEEMADMGPLRPVIYGPVARQNPFTRGGALAIALLAVAAAVAMLVFGWPRGSREAGVRAEQAMQALLLDDDKSLEQAAALFGEAARLTPAYEGDRAVALLLRGSAQQDLAERLEPLSRGDPAAAAEREALLLQGARLVQEGSAAAQAAAARAPEEVPALRAMALAAALTSGNPARWLEAAERKAPGDPLVAVARAATALAGGRSGEAQDRALAALSAARAAQPRLLRAQVDAAALALDRGELASARQGLQRVVEENPAHERAKRLLLSLAQP
ncbi:MAG TPA: MJ0042-type zinc finger domain-containing protein [Myxococcales bacterium]|nr:MJ0042-type zinc finger domain-containing protein [Myxococcales bacterium]